MVRKTQRATKLVSPSIERLVVSDHQDTSTTTTRQNPGDIEDPLNLSALELVKAILDINRDPAVERLALALSQKICIDVSKVANEEKRSRSIVISGFPGAAPNLRLSDRQIDLENKVMELLDVVDVECRQVEVYRLGRPDPSRPRLIKVKEHNRRRKKERKKERKKDYELRQIAKEKNAGQPRKEWVVYRGEVRKISDLPNTSSSGNY
ncbi:hypothetical protein Aduo_012526 [Ancylostoma duodenale]